MEDQKEITRRGAGRTGAPRGVMKGGPVVGRADGNHGTAPEWSATPSSHRPATDGWSREGTMSAALRVFWRLWIQEMILSINPT